MSIFPTAIQLTGPSSSATGSHLLSLTFPWVKSAQVEIFLKGSRNQIPRSESVEVPAFLSFLLTSTSLAKYLSTFGQFPSNLFLMMFACDQKSMVSNKIHNLHIIQPDLLPAYLRLQRGQSEKSCAWWRPSRRARPWPGSPVTRWRVTCQRAGASFACRWREPSFPRNISFVGSLEPRSDARLGSQRRGIGFLLCQKTFLAVK